MLTALLIRHLIPARMALSRPLPCKQTERLSLGENSPRWVEAALAQLRATTSVVSTLTALLILHLIQVRTALSRPLPYKQTERFSLGDTSPRWVEAALAQLRAAASVVSTLTALSIIHLTPVRVAVCSLLPYKQTEG